MWTNGSGTREGPLAGPAAFSTAVEPHRRALEAHCLGLLGSLEDAQDATQETLLRAWRSRSTFRGDAKLRSWLYRIATNVCFDLRRRRASRPPTAARGSDLDLAEVPAPEPEPDFDVIARETTELAMLEAIRHLPPKQRGALVLHGVMGCSARETAAMLESSSVSVSSALQRARRTLADRLPANRIDWTASVRPSGRELDLLRRYVEAIEVADAEGFVRLLDEEVGRAGA